MKLENQLLFQRTKACVLLPYTLRRRNKNLQRAYVKGHVTKLGLSNYANYNKNPYHVIQKPNRQRANNNKKTISKFSFQKKTKL